VTGPHFDSFFFGNMYKNGQASVVLATDLEDKNNYNNIEIEAGVAYIYDIYSGSVLYNKNAEMQFPLASVTKLMTALVAYEFLPPSTIIEIESKHLQPEGDVGLIVGEKWRLRDLTAFMLMSSSNDAAHALSSTISERLKKTETLYEETFVGFMNSKAKKLGLTQTYFLNETGLDIAGNATGGYGSARDIAKLLSYMYANHPELVEITSYKNKILRSSEAMHSIKNTNPHVGQIPGLIASKTGYTDMAGGNLAVLFDIGPARPVVAIVLGSSQDGRFDDMDDLVWATITKEKIP